MMMIDASHAAVATKVAHRMVCFVVLDPPSLVPNPSHDPRVHPVDHRAVEVVKVVLVLVVVVTTRVLVVVVLTNHPPPRASPAARVEDIWMTFKHTQKRQSEQLFIHVSTLYQYYYYESVDYFYSLMFYILKNIVYILVRLVGEMNCTWDPFSGKLSSHIKQSPVPSLTTRLNDGEWSIYMNGGHIVIAYMYSMDNGHY
jgi:hypothetical protein